MSKIVFIQDGMRDRYGILCLYTYLKKHNHESEVFISDVEDDIVGAVLNSNPDIIGFSTMTTEFKIHQSIAEQIKKRRKDLPIIVGGSHPTFYPEIINDPNIDVVCLNEGEYALVELLNIIGEDGDLGQAINIKSLWVKYNNKVYKNEMGDLIKDLDEVSPKDRDIYCKRYEELRGRPTKTIYVGRGCPFDCTYCFNHALKKMIKGKGSMIRLRSINNVFNEIRILKEKYGLQWVHFNDDTFNFRREWLNEFLERYPNEIGIPFFCNVRADFLDEELVVKLKNAGIVRVNFGIEHGSYEIRKKLLKRNITDEQLIRAGELFRKYKIRVFASNIMGLPGETMDDAMKTIEINRKIKPEFSGVTLLQPFPKTDIYEYAKDRGVLSDDFSFDQLTGCSSVYTNKVSKSPINQKNIMILENIQKLSHYLIHYPFLTFLIKGILVKIPLTNFYERLYLFPLYLIQIKYENSFKRKVAIIKRLFSLT
jgi:radical SAM superfamily enzyme YgiQ (UPF0313 family)